MDQLLFLAYVPILWCCLRTQSFRSRFDVRYFDHHVDQILQILKKVNGITDELTSNLKLIANNLSRYWILRQMRLSMHLQRSSWFQIHLNTDKAVHIFSMNPIRSRNCNHHMNQPFRCMNFQTIPLYTSICSRTSID